MRDKEKIERFTIDIILLYLCRMEAFTTCHPLSHGWPSLHKIYRTCVYNVEAWNSTWITLAGRSGHALRLDGVARVLERMVCVRVREKER